MPNCDSGPSADFLGRRKCGRGIKVFHFPRDLRIERSRQTPYPVNAAFAAIRFFQKTSVDPDRRDDTEAGDDTRRSVAMVAIKLKRAV